MAPFLLLVGGVAYYVEFDVLALGRWPAWCLSLVAWAVWEALRPVVSARGGGRTGDGDAKVPA